MTRDAAKAATLAGFRRRRRLARAMASPAWRVPALPPPVDPVFPAVGFQPSARPRPLVSRVELDELLEGQRRERRRAVARRAELGRLLGVVCAVTHCAMPVWGGAAAVWGPAYCLTHDPDEVAVERAMAGDRSVTLWPHERDLAIARLARSGVSDPQIAARLGVTDKTVSRRRHAHGIPPALPQPRREDLAS